MLLCTARFFAVLPWLAIALASCVPPPAAPSLDACAGGPGTPMREYQLFFGRSISGGGEVDAAAWSSFLAQVVTPNLPEGYTAFDADGAWQAPDGTRTVHERTKVLLVALPDTPAAAAAIARIRAAYAHQFRQSVVGMFATAGCGAFTP